MRELVRIRVGVRTRIAWEIKSQQTLIVSVAILVRYSTLMLVPNYAGKVKKKRKYDHDSGYGSSTYHVTCHANRSGGKT